MRSQKEGMVEYATQASHPKRKKMDTAESLAGDF
jgi:hypothetical protein